MVNISPFARFLDHIQGDITINGNADGNNSLNIYNQNNYFNDTYTITSSRVQRNSSAQIRYSAVKNLIVNDGSRAVTFNVESTNAATPVTINEGLGQNTVNLSPTARNLATVQGRLTVSGNSHMDRLQLFDQNNTAVRSFSVTSTTPVWTGGPTVTDTQVSFLTVNGGNGGNTFNVISTSATDGVLINGGGGTNNLMGSSAGNVWEVTGADSGVLSGSAYASAVSFNQVGNLTGGNGGDYFLFDDQAALSGSLSGGGATLDYTPYSTSVIVDLQTGFATGVGQSVMGILNVIGASGAPGSGAYNLLIGNGGNTLTGGFGRRNILVAGGSASSLNAGDQEDLLIGGTTIYDTEPGLLSWLEIAAYWAGTDDFFTRVANLTKGNGVPLLDATTVIGNGGGNIMNGNGGLALIYSDGMDAISSFDPNSPIIPVAP